MHSACVEWEPGNEANTAPLQAHMPEGGEVGEEEEERNLLKALVYRGVLISECLD